MNFAAFALVCLANVCGTRRVSTTIDRSQVDRSLEFWSSERNDIDRNAVKLTRELDHPTSHSENNRLSSHALAGLLLSLNSPATLRNSARIPSKTVPVPARGAQPLAIVPTAIDAPLVLAARGEVLDHPTVWLFRQAGRHMNEYKKYKSETGKMFLDFLKNSTDMATITLQPMERYEVDAAIIFSDILVVPEAMGINLAMPGGKGIMVTNPLEKESDLEHLNMPTDAADAARLVQDKLGHVTEAVRLIVDRLNQNHDGKPLIGFSAAPWTIFYYMVGSNSKVTDLGERFLKEHPAASERLLDSITNVLIEYLSAQAESGCKVLQLFDAMTNETMISQEHFLSLALPRMKKIKDELKSRYPEIPVMVFARGAAYALPHLKGAGFDVLTLDNSVNLATIRDEVPDVCLQGAFDRKFFVRKDGYDEARVEEEAIKMIERLGPKNLIVNLLEGFHGNEDQNLVNTFVKTIQAYPARLSS